MRSPIVSLLVLLMVVQGTLSHPASLAAESTSVMGETVHGQAAAAGVKAMAMRSSDSASEKDSVAARFLGQNYGS